MPNLVGIWNPPLAADSIRATLSKQLSRVRVAGNHYQEYVAALPGFGVGLQDHGILENGPQPAATEDGSTLLVLDGELYNAAELAHRFRAELPSRPVAAPELCLRLIVRHGPDVVNQFNGLFVIVLYDRATRRATLISDRYGFRPLFYVHRSGMLLFGSEVKAIAAADPAPRRIDEIGLLEFFAYGTHAFDRTSIEGYHRLPPATILTFDLAEAHQRRYWVYKYDESAQVLDQQTYATVFGTLLDRATERCMQGSRRIGIFLSGGYDSRSVAAAIRSYHLPIPAFTFGLSDSRDVRFGSMLAARLGLKHHPLTEHHPYLYRYSRSIVWRTEGLLPFADLTSIRYHDIYRQYIDIFLTGFLGEFSGSHTWPRLLLARSRSSAIDAIYDRLLGQRLPAAQRLFNPSFFARTLEAVEGRFRTSFESIPNDHPQNVADSWNVVNLQPRGTYQSPAVDRHLLECRAPHMDSELVSFLLSIPPYARLEQRVYKKMIAYAFPAIRDVPCTNSGKAINPHFFREYTLMSARYAVRKVTRPVTRLLPRHEPLGRNFRNLDDDFRAEPELVTELLRPLLKADMFPSAIFDHAAIEEIVDEHYERAGAHSATLSRLISWALAAKYFIHDDLSDVPAELYAP